jgi:Ras-related protein Rab-28
LLQDHPSLIVAYTFSLSLRCTQAVLFVYDITNHDSFLNLEDWYRIVQQTFSGTALPYLALIGNKSTYLNGHFYACQALYPHHCVVTTVHYVAPTDDLAHIRHVSQDLHNAFADENGMHGFVISAKSGHQV